MKVLDFAADNIYGVKFDFQSGSPGYVGDLYHILISLSAEPQPENLMSYCKPE